jgi:N-methylhydantoinase A/oxoprolinase/acetone carboxylase beta subunit
MMQLAIDIGGTFTDFVLCVRHKNRKAECLEGADDSD